MKSTRASGLVLAGAVGLAGLGVGTTFGPSVASAATTTTQAAGDRVSSIRSAIAGLVTNGTISQAQADKVATTLGSADGVFGGRGGRGGGRGVDLTTAASAIGVTADDLRTQLQAGKTLAEVAKSKGVSQATLVDKLVATEKTRIAAAVKAGTMTQAQADTRLAGLTAQVTTQVITDCFAVGGRGFGGGRGPGDGTTTAPSTPTTPTTPTTPATPVPDASASAAA